MSNTKQKHLREQRRATLSQSSVLSGIDFIKLSPMTTTTGTIPYKIQIDLYLANNNLQSIAPKNISITKGINNIATDFTITLGTPAINGNKINFTIGTNDKKKFEQNISYTLTLINLTTIDSFFDRINFSISDESVANFDCHVSSATATSTTTVPDIDYLTKDYDSFRQLMLNRMSTLIPAWKERHTADTGIMMIEMLAYVADQLAYYQDAVATEAYLGTARRRISVKRHARLFDYDMHEGCNARVWIHVPVIDDPAKPEGIFLQERTTLFTKVQGVATIMNSMDNLSLPDDTEVFQTMYPVNLFEQYNEIKFYTWGAKQFYLEKGATKATLAGEYPDLHPDMILMFEEVKGSKSGKLIDASPTQRHAVRLTKVDLNYDALNEQPVTEIEWHPQDALPTCFCIANIINHQHIVDMTVLRGNIVLADHGNWVKQDKLVPNVVPEGIYRPHLKQKNITFQQPFELLTVNEQPAKLMIKQNVRATRAVVNLTQNDEELWYANYDLLNSESYSSDFVVEIENDRRAYIRFGDNEFGKRPRTSTTFTADYRVGNGTQGNIGAETIHHIVSEYHANIGQVRNLLPAQGGIDPESIEQVRRNVPRAFQRQQRTVTNNDYAVFAARYPEVKRAATVRRWVGSWYVFFIAVERKEGLVLDPLFKQRLLDYLEDYRVINHEIEIIEPRYIPLDITLVVRLKSGFSKNVVRQSLQQHFSATVSADGKKGFFHQDNFGFGKSIYLSNIVTEATKISGVNYIDIKSNKMVFRRQSETGREALENGVINLQPLEIVRVLNDPLLPEKGRIQFYFLESK